MPEKLLLALFISPILVTPSPPLRLPDEKGSAKLKGADADPGQLLGPAALPSQAFFLALLNLSNFTRIKAQEIKKVSVLEI